jgi:hypothetical protein
MDPERIERLAVLVGRGCDVDAIMSDPVVAPSSPQSVRNMATRLGLPLPEAVPRGGLPAWREHIGRSSTAVPRSAGSAQMPSPSASSPPSSTTSSSTRCSMMGTNQRRGQSDHLSTRRSRTKVRCTRPTRSRGCSGPAATCSARCARSPSAPRRSGCAPRKRSNMGEAAGGDAVGQFFLQTAVEPPYVARRCPHKHTLSFGGEFSRSHFAT